MARLFDFIEADQILLSVGQITFDFQKSCQAQESKRIKNISLHNSGNQNYNSARLAPARGAYHDRHDTLGAGCDGRFGVRRFLAPDENAEAYGEVVWSWRRDAGAKLCGRVSVK